MTSPAHPRPQGIDLDQVLYQGHLYNGASIEGQLVMTSEEREAFKKRSYSHQFVKAAPLTMAQQVALSAYDIERFTRAHKIMGSNGVLKVNIINAIALEENVNCRPISALAIADTLEQPRETVRRTLLELEKLGWVLKEKGGWLMGPKCIERVPKNVETLHLFEQVMEVFTGSDENLPRAWQRVHKSVRCGTKK